MHNFFLTLTFSLLILLPLSAQKQVTVSGIITDSDSGESLIGATVIAPALGLGTNTNEYGFYSLSLAQTDSVSIEFSYVGFEKKIRRIALNIDLKLDIELGSGYELEEVIIKANSFEEKLQSTEMSVEVITTKEARLIPVLFGESDILKTIQLKPGIPSGAEGTTGLFVRGGGSDQNLIILDEAVVYNANHLFGFFSTFNTDAVKDLKLYKGGFPARYGGRLSSVVDVKLKEGNNKKFSGSGGLGLITSRLTLEGPIQKEKSSFIVSGRRTYVDIFTNLSNQANEGKEDFSPIPAYYFYDLNTKVNYKLGEKDKIYLSGYFGRDVFGFDGDFFDFNFDWGNATGSLRWNHVYNPKLFSNTTLTYSDYQYNIRNRITGFSFNVGSNIRDSNLKSDFYYALNNRHTLRFGTNLTYHQFTVGRLRAGSSDGTINFSAGQEFKGLQMGLYLSDEFTVSDRLKIHTGLRLSGFNYQSQTYFGLEPRFSGKYSLSKRFTLKASYARMHQYLHLVSSAGIALPTDIWYPSTENVTPQSSDQTAIGFSYLFGKDLLVTIESYYKWLHKQLEFVDGAELFVNNNLEEEFAIGKGRGYGLEISMEKKAGKLTGWIGYTLALIEKGEFKPLFEGNSFTQEGYFPPIYDRRHDLSVVLMYKIIPKLTATVTFVYGSGDLRWLAPGRFAFQDIYGSSFESIVPDYRERNNFRLPPYHRMDVGLVYTIEPKWGKTDLTLNIVNVYDRRNTFFIYLEPEFVPFSIGSNTFVLPNRVVAQQVSLFPILPSLTWNFRF